jgi:hypothetical protein
MQWEARIWFEKPNCESYKWWIYRYRENGIENKNLSPCEIGTMCGALVGGGGWMKEMKVGNTVDGFHTHTANRTMKLRAIAWSRVGMGSSRGDGGGDLTMYNVSLFRIVKENPPNIS